MLYTIKQIPQKIREHLGSDSTVKLIGSFNSSCHIYPFSAIPSLLYQLITKKFTAQEFVTNAERELDLSEDLSIALVREIKEKILEPIHDELMSWGIDTSHINVTAAKNLSNVLEENRRRLKEMGITLEQEELTPQGLRTISIDALSGESKMEAKKIPIQRIEIPSSAESKGTAFVPSKEGTPLIIHQAKPVAEERSKSSL
ncbi:hypothetical protein HY967_00340, partial [Candidatus Jorgensenbacteria bacterium]|nr:hypothetical protein [Candidatus Jorgensenbacteria bacterium]